MIIRYFSTFNCSIMNKMRGIDHRKRITLIASQERIWSLNKKARNAVNTPTKQTSKVKYFNTSKLMLKN